MTRGIPARRALHALLATLAILLALAPAALAHDLGADDVDAPHADPRSEVPDSLIVRPVAQAELAAVAPVTVASVTPGLPETWCGDPDPTANDTAHAVV